MIALHNSAIGTVSEVELQLLYQSELDECNINNPSPVQIWISAHHSLALTASTKSQVRRNEHSLYPFVWVSEDPSDDVEQERNFYRMLFQAEHEATISTEDAFTVALMLEAEDFANTSGGEVLSSDLQALKSLQELFNYTMQELRCYTQMSSSKLGYMYHGSSRGAFCFERLDHHYNTLRDALKDMSDEYRFT